MQKVLQTVVIAMATFSECYEESSQVMQIASSLLNGGKYFADYNLRAKQVCMFCSWSLIAETKY